MNLVAPSLERLGAYADALKRGFWSNNLRREESRREELEKIDADPVAFVASLDDREAKGGPIVMPDGSQVARLPGFRCWMWEDGADGGFCGQIGFRWQKGTEALPPHCLGHIGYAVVPWKQKRGHATRALALMLGEARREGLRWVELTTAPDNEGSQKVITNNGGVFVERFHTVAGYGGKEEFRWRIKLD